MIDIYYKKNDNNSLFIDFENIGIKSIQNYVPIYKKFFSLTDNNYNNQNLYANKWVDSIINFRC